MHTAIMSEHRVDRCCSFLFEKRSLSFPVDRKGVRGDRVRGGVLVRMAGQFLIAAWVNRWWRRKMERVLKQGSIRVILIICAHNILFFDNSTHHSCQPIMSVTKLDYQQYLSESSKARKPSASTFPFSTRAI
jgi:hypothetical protein